jgi:hypothetical protein
MAGEMDNGLTDAEEAEMERILRQLMPPMAVYLDVFRPDDKRPFIIKAPWIDGNVAAK